MSLGGGGAIDRVFTVVDSSLRVRPPPHDNVRVRPPRCLIEGMVVIGLEIEARWNPVYTTTTVDGIITFAGDSPAIAACLSIYRRRR